MEAMTYPESSESMVVMPHPLTRGLLQRAIVDCQASSAVLGLFAEEEQKKVLRWWFAAGSAEAATCFDPPMPCPLGVLGLSHGDVHPSDAACRAVLSRALHRHVEQGHFIVCRDIAEPLGVICVFNESADKKLETRNADVMCALADLASAAITFEKERARRIVAEKHQAFMAGIFNSTTEGIWSVGLDGLITFVNDAAVKLFAFDSAEQMLGHNSHELVHYKYADGTPYPMALCPIFKAFREGVPAHLTDEVLWRADGTSFYAEYRTTPIFVKGKIIGTVTTFTDNTVRRLAEKKVSDNAHRLALTVSELEDERALRERFISTLTHDLRTPIAAALLGAQSLPRKTDGNPVIQKTCDRIAGSMRRAENLIRNLLDINRVKAGKKIPIEVAAMRLDRLLEDGISELNQIHGERVILQNSAGQVDGHWDANGVLRVLDNLVGNAIKYGSNEAPVTVSLTSEGDKARFSVHNQGEPVPADEQAGLFEPYYRAPSALEGGQKGWGLGLSLVKEIIESHGGHVWLQSSKREGTTFHVDLPRDFGIQP